MDTEDLNKHKKFRTSSGLESKEFLRPEDLAGADHERDVGFPGEFPFTRGVHPSGYRSRLWTRKSVV